MSLSAGTLNLKFMQRAASRPSTSTSTSSSSTRPPPPTPATLTATSAPTPFVPENDSEFGIRWSLPSRSTSGPSPKRAKIGEGEGIRFESSYMPFLSGEVEAEASSRGRGGRMAFGGFGVKEDDEDGDEDEDEDGKAAQVGLAPEENHDKGEIQRRQPENRMDKRHAHGPRPDRLRSRSPAPPAHPPEAKTFQLPAGFSPPPKSEPSPARKATSEPRRASQKMSSRDVEPRTASAPVPGRKMSVADRLRQTISTSRTSTSDKAIVRPLNEDEKERKTPPSTSPPDIKTDFVETGDGDAKPSYFDDRLREMREQKRRDKRARKMARRGEEKAALKAAKVGGS